MSCAEVLSKTEQETPLQPSLLLCTANVFCFHCCKPQELLVYLISNLGDYRDNKVVVIGFQEITQGSLPAFKRVFRDNLPDFALHCYKESSNPISLYNAIAVYPASVVVSSQKVDLDLPRSDSDRCGVGVGITIPHWDCGELRVMVVHLAGGRYDDCEWQERRAQRTAEVNRVMGSSIIMGDFNSDNQFDPALLSTAYWEEKRNGGTNAELMEYMTDPHPTMASAGYCPLIDREELKTTVKGLDSLVCDWMYARGDLAACTTFVSKKIPAIADGVSDHDFPVTIIRHK